MLDLFKQFLSFDKLMKDKLVSVFFFLGLVVIAFGFLGNLWHAFGNLFDGAPLSASVSFFAAFFKILFMFVLLRLISELMIAVFHINNNLSPDGGKGDTADIDVFETTRDAANKAAKSASTATKTAYEKTKTKIAERGKDDDDYPDYDDVTPPKPKAKRKPAAKKTAVKKPAVKKTPVKKAAAKKAPAKKAPAKKPAAKKPAAKKTTTRKTAPKK